MAETRPPRANRLDGLAWRTFLGAILVRDRIDGMRCRRQPLRPSDRRQVARWLNEGQLPSFWTADEFLTRYGVHIDEFFRFAESLGRTAWASGEAPAWHTED